MSFVALMNDGSARSGYWHSSITDLYAMSGYINQDALFYAMEDNPSFLKEIISQDDDWGEEDD